LLGEIEHGAILGVDRTARSSHLARWELLGIQQRMFARVAATSFLEG
jgi:hypothetical protein